MIRWTLIKRYEAVKEAKLFETYILTILNFLMMGKSKRGEQLFSHHLSPKMRDVKVYFSQKGISEKEAEDFFHVYEQRQWKSKRGNFYQNWKAIAYRWIVSVWKENPLLFKKRASE